MHRSWMRYVWRMPLFFISVDNNVDIKCESFSDKPNLVIVVYFEIYWFFASTIIENTMSYIYCCEKTHARKFVHFHEIM